MKVTVDATNEGRYTIAYILGSGHCGSTLFDFLLNGHSQIVGLGELVRLDRHEWQDNPGQDDVGYPSTSFWQETKQCYESATGNPFEGIETRNSRWRDLRRWPQERVVDWAKTQSEFLTCIHQITGAAILTDASKFPHRLHLLHESGLFDIRVIHLIRDGRAVINSYLRKYHSFGLAMSRWAAPTWHAISLRRRTPQDMWLTVRYEDLARNPAQVLTRTCKFLGVDYKPSMLSYRDHRYVGIGGNKMRHRSDSKIYLDDAWKRELSYKHRVMFGVSGGWLNALYGYGVA